jgi:hypothetical protein
MTKLRFIFVLFVLSLLSGACKKTNNDAPSEERYESYFGLVPGRFIVYDVQEVFHDETAEIKHDTINYQLKTLIGDTIRDNAGRISRKFLRYKRSNSLQNWVLSDVWTTLIDGHYAELVEENQRIVKMLFPVEIGKVWNSNVFNVNKSTEYFYDKIHESLKLNGIYFDSTVRIEQEKKRNFVEYKRKFEIYGNRIGMISKYFKDLKISNFDTLNIKSGHELNYTCTDFGIE